MDNLDTNQFRLRKQGLGVGEGQIVRREMEPLTPERTYNIAEVSVAAATGGIGGAVIRGVQAAMRIGQAAKISTATAEKIGAAIRAYPTADAEVNTFYALVVGLPKRIGVWEGANAGRLVKQAVVASAAPLAAEAQIYGAVGAVAAATALGAASQLSPDSVNPQMSESSGVKFEEANARLPDRPQVGLPNGLDKTIGNAAARGD